MLTKIILKKNDTKLQQFLFYWRGNSGCPFKRGGCRDDFLRDYRTQVKYAMDELGFDSLFYDMFEDIEMPDDLIFEMPKRSV